MLQIFAAIGSFLGGPLTSIFSSGMDVLKSDKVQEASEFAAMTGSQQAMYVSAMQASQALAATKAQVLTTRMGQFMMLVYGLPPAVYIGMVFVTAAFPNLGLHADPIKGDLGRDLIVYAKTIGLSFFIVTPTVAFGDKIFSGLASWLRPRA